MKAFTILVILFLLFLIIATTGVAQVDLTPDTPPAAANPPIIFTDGSTGDNVITIQDDVPITFVDPVPQVVLPVTGECTNPYIVRSGDILSSIAVLCDTTVASIRLANPQITNANMIYPGQRLVIPAADASEQASQAQPVQPTPLATFPGVIATEELPAPVTGQPTVMALPTSEAAPPAQQPTPTGDPDTDQIPVVQSGTDLEVQVADFPPNAPVHIAIGPRTSGYDIVTIGTTDENGRLSTTVEVPALDSDDPLVPWVIVVATVNPPVVQIMSDPFFIAPNASENQEQQ